MPRRTPSKPLNGGTYKVVTCPWCGGPAPVYSDRRGNPWARCSKCECRFFGTMLAFGYAESSGRVVEVAEWPPRNWGEGMQVGLG